jgi:aryl-alcohol dehydrogenase-like predicted oxidoreductase
MPMTKIQSASFDWSRITIGTAQFGRRYGVSNQSGMVSMTDAEKILEEASSYGIDALDTAISYGKSEEILGKIGVKSWRIISKIPRLPDNITDISSFVLQQIETSLNRLNVDSLDGLLMHDPSQLLEKPGHLIYQALSDFKAQGLIKNIGLSIYDPTNLGRLIEERRFDILQSPYNVFDQRIIDSGWLERMDRENIAFHARSIFLQGLLLMKKRPLFFNRWSINFDYWNQWLSKEGLTPLEGCLYCAISNLSAKKIIVGLDSLEHLQQIRDAILKVENIKIEIPQFGIQDLTLLNPGKWNLT